MSHVLQAPGSLPAAAAWQPGGVCNGSIPAERNFVAALKGKNLRVTVYVCPQSEITQGRCRTITKVVKDTTKTGNAQYSGFSVDLMDAIALELGITYEIQDLKRGNKSWTV